MSKKRSNNDVAAAASNNLNQAFISDNDIDDIFYIGSTIRPISSIHPSNANASRRNFDYGDRFNQHYNSNNINHNSAAAAAVEPSSVVRFISSAAATNNSVAPMTAAAVHHHHHHHHKQQQIRHGTTAALKPHHQYPASYSTMTKGNGATTIQNTHHQRQQEPPPQHTKASSYVSYLYTRTCLIILTILVLLVAVAIVGALVTYVLVSSSYVQKREQQTKLENARRSSTPSTIATTATTTTTSSLPATTSLAYTLADRCGITKNNKPVMISTRIINGLAAQPGSWPWIVSIGFYGPRGALVHACGGSLINERFVVTASHCVVKRSIFSLIGNPVPGSDKYNSLESMMRVYVGVTVRSIDISVDKTYYVSKIISYPNFDEATFANDVTLLQLDRAVNVSTPAFNDSVGFVCLSKVTHVQPGDLVYAAGWGYTQDDFTKASDRLMQVQLPIKPFDKCQLSYIPMLQFCAGNEPERKDTCNGDSGGPVMQLNSNNQWILAGIVSNGDAQCTGKGIYTNISNYYSWILQNAQFGDEKPQTRLLL